MSAESIEARTLTPTYRDSTAEKEEGTALAGSRNPNQRGIRASAATGIVIADVAKWSNAPDL
jgi:hypothetical protein